MDVTGEGSDDDATLCLLDDALEALAYFALGRSERALHRVGRVGHHEIDAFLAKTGKGAEIGDDTVDWRLVKLEVARVQHVSSWAAEENAN